MLKMIRELLRGERHDRAGRQMYSAAVAQARQPYFYRSLGVADTVDGRFDMICLHVFLLFYRLKSFGDEGRALAQEVFDIMFRDMDESLREMGVGDVSVPKKVKKMASAFYGRIEAYDTALQSSEQSDLKKALGRNIYREEVRHPDQLDRLAGYVRGELAFLGEQRLETLALGNYWPRSIDETRR